MLQYWCIEAGGRKTRRTRFLWNSPSIEGNLSALKLCFCSSSMTVAGACSRSCLWLYLSCVSGLLPCQSCRLWSCSASWRAVLWFSFQIKKLLSKRWKSNYNENSYAISKGAVKFQRCNFINGLTNQIRINYIWHFAAGLLYSKHKSIIFEKGLTDLLGPEWKVRPCICHHSQLHWQSGEQSQSALKASKYLNMVSNSRTIQSWTERPKTSSQG